jgi:hypothetical protein
LLDRWDRGRWPRLLRGDLAWGIEPVMAQAEQRWCGLIDFCFVAHDHCCRIKGAADLGRRLNRSRGNL